MDIIDIPFSKKVGIQRTAAGTLELPFNKDVHNHIETFHASAQFVLAETSSGDILQDLFPDLVGTVIPVLRKSKIKFRNGIKQNLCAYPSISLELREKFLDELNKNGRAFISVNVELRNPEGIVACSAVFTWYVQFIN